GDDAIAIEAFPGQQLVEVGEVGERDRRRIGLSDQAQDALRLDREGCTGLRIGAQRLERHLVAPAQQVVGILEVVPDPACRFDQLRRADAPVGVGVDEIERAGIELQPARRAGERRPELLVEVLDVDDVRAAADDDLVDSGDTDELPAMRGNRAHAAGASPRRAAREVRRRSQWTRSASVIIRASRMRSQKYRGFSATVMYTCRQRLLVRLPKHPTIAGYFWLAYFLALGALIFG